MYATSITRLMSSSSRIDFEIEKRKFYEFDGDAYICWNPSYVRALANFFFILFYLVIVSGLLLLLLLLLAVVFILSIFLSLSYKIDKDEPPREHLTQNRVVTLRGRLLKHFITILHELWFTVFVFFVSRHFCLLFTVYETIVWTCSTGSGSIHCPEQHIHILSVCIESNMSFDGYFWITRRNY